MFSLKPILSLQSLWVFGVAFAVTFILTPLMVRVAQRWRFLDQPAFRKIHAEPIPCTGGLAIGMGVMVGMFGVPMPLNIRVGLLGGILTLILLGFYDDVFGIRPQIKLGGQTLAALWAIAWGVKVTFIRLPLLGMASLGAWSVPLSLFWIVLIINTINLIDGIDGLAAGVTFIVGLALLLTGHLLNQTGVLLFVLALLGSLLAFLRYNFNPARIFMGDSGSMVCGFLLAAASILGVFKTTTTMALAVPVLALGLPLTDTGLAVLRRLRSGRSIFSPDRQHVHHWLLAKGMTQRQVAVTAYSITMLLSIIAVSMVALVTAAARH